jgi:hypothetical protein
MYGFYFDQTVKKIKCCECQFQLEDLYVDRLSDILSQHYKFSAVCSQVEMSLTNCQYNHAETESKTPMLLESVNKRVITDETPTPAPQQSEEYRANTFVHTKMLFDVKKLVAAGFYRVKAPIEDADNTQFSNDNNIKSRPSSHIEEVAKQVAVLIHLKCAFCKYECLIFRNSWFNTLYKSPFDEHKENFFMTCSTFAAARGVGSGRKMDLTGTSLSNSKLKHLSEEQSALDQFDLDVMANRYAWLQILYDFELTNTSSFNKKLAKNMISTASAAKNKSDILELKQLPKVITQLILMHNESEDLSSTPTNTFINNTNTKAIMYAPHLISDKSSKISSEQTSDLNLLQPFLQMSDNVISARAYHPAYTLLDSRLESFKEWPATLSQQPADLAKAGFYYFGIKDMVKCFFCNGGLKNWDQNDDPFQDHVRWFPKCQFVRQLMGAEYIEKVREKFKSMDSGFTNEDDANGTNNMRPLSQNLTTASAGVNTRGKRSISPRTLNSRLDTHIIRKIIDANLGLSKESIKLSLEKKLSQNPALIRTNSNGQINYGQDFKSSFEMAQMSYFIERSKQKNLKSFKSISDLLICNLPEKINVSCLNEIFQIKFAIYPENIKIIKEQGTVENCLFAFVNLKKEDSHLLNSIADDLNGKPLPGFSTTNSNLLVLKTNWIEIEEKVKPYLNQPTCPSTTSSLLEEQNESICQSEQQATTSNSHDAKSAISSETTNANKDNSQVLNSNIANINYKKHENDYKEENERLKNERLCVICLTKDKNVLFLPCAHLAACLECSMSLKTCPICRSKIQATVRTFT